MRYFYKTKYTCASEISFDLNDGIVTDIHFNGGCNGNLKMISKLLEGKKATDIVSACSGNICGSKPTSCADQLAKAVAKAIEKDVSK